ncbi:MAG: hypothetical protein Q7R81_03135 [Candidatus Peregrinibacteria bacterium]|nr:hypothetical protein [Candidatus Peregrinibacteria bacterium]
MQPIQNTLLSAYEFYADDIFRHCYLRLLDREQGKQILEDTFKRTWSYLSEGATPEDIRALLYRMANALIEEYRKGREGLVAAPAAVPEKEAEIVPVLRTFDAIDRDILVMHFIDQMDAPAIAALMSLSTEDVHVRLDSARSTLTAKL